MKLHRTLTAVAVAGVLTAGGAVTTAATSAAATPSTGSTTASAAVKAKPHVKLTVLVTGKGKNAHLVVRERGAAAGGAAYLGAYDLTMDGHLVQSGIGPARCTNKPVKSFDTTRRPARIHLVAGHHVVKISQDYCKTPGAAKYASATHTVAFTAK